MAERPHREPVEQGEYGEAFGGPVFVVGMPRSGTKMLRDLLNQHPRVAIPRVETEFLPDWSRRWQGFGDLSQPAAFHAFYEQVRGSAYFTYMAEDEGGAAPEAAWREACEGFELAEVFEALIRVDTATVGRGEVVWGDKSPGYIRHLPLLDEHFEACRVVHIVRDVRDYALSMQAAWNKHPLRAAQRWADRVGLAREVGTLLGPRYLELRYEDLLDAPQAQLQGVVAFLGLPWEPGLEHLRTSTENLGQTRGKVGIQQGNKEKWRTAMDPQLRQQIEALAGPTLRALGYPCDYAGPQKRVSKARMLALQARDGVELVRADARKRGAVGALRFRLRMFRESGKVGG